MSKIESYDPKEKLNAVENIEAVEIVLALANNHLLTKEDLAYIRVLNNRLSKEQGIDL